MSSENTTGFLNILGNTFGDIINENYNIVNDTATTDYTPESRDDSEDIFKHLKSCSFKKGEDEISCPICLEEFKDNESVIELPCKHVFHKPCIKQWFKNNYSCPTCRKKIEIPNDINNTNQNPDIFGNWINNFVSSITNQVETNRINDVVGSRVTLYGIITRPELNGQNALIIRHHRNDRYMVRLNNNSDVSISIRNMTINRGIMNESIINNINAIINDITRENEISRIMSGMISPGIQLRNILDGLYESQFSNLGFNSW